MACIKGKVFLIDDEEWIVDEVLLYGFKCICRSLSTDHRRDMLCEWVTDKIRSYEQDKIELKKDQNAWVFREDDEKELLRKIINSFLKSISVLEFGHRELPALQHILDKLSD